MARSVALVSEGNARGRRRSAVHGAAAVSYVGGAMFSDPAHSAAALASLLKAALARPGRCLFLTGAGISAESGIPTFRGPEGYWRVGSRNFHPQELATRAAFEAMPAAVWGWYLHRYRTCAQAQPNPAHHALVQAAQLLGER